MTSFFSLTTKLNYKVKSTGRHKRITLHEFRRISNADFVYWSIRLLIGAFLSRVWCLCTWRTTQNSRGCNRCVRVVRTKREPKPPLFTFSLLLASSQATACPNRLCLLFYFSAPQGHEKSKVALATSFSVWGRWRARASDSPSCGNRPVTTF